MPQPTTKRQKNGKGRDTRRPGEETQSAFIDVATQLFAEKGYNGTSIADIARAMNLTTASLYYYVSGKQELLLRVLNAGMAEFLDRLESIAERKISPKIKLRLAIENHLSFVLIKKNAVAVFLRERRFLESPYREEYQTRVERYDLLFTIIIQDAMDAGTIPPGDPHLIRLAILGMINWAVEWYQPGGRLGSKEITKIFADLITERMLATEHYTPSH